MGFWSKLVILTLAVLAFFYVKVNFFDTPHTPHVKVEKKLTVEEQVAEPPQKTQQQQEPVKKASKEPERPTTYVTVYFLGMDKNNSSIFNALYIYFYNMFCCSYSNCFHSLNNNSYF